MLSQKFDISELVEKNNKTYTITAKGIYYCYNGDVINPPEDFVDYQELKINNNTLSKLEKNTKKEIESSIDEIIVDIISKKHSL
jgi:hypothetical protein